MPPNGKTDLAHVEEAKNANVGDIGSDHSLDPMDEARITKAILWKLDTRMLPMLALLFLFSFLDRYVVLFPPESQVSRLISYARTNIGNVKILGLTKDLKLTGGRYANCLAIFYAFYIASEVPSNLIIKRASPRLWLGILTFFWGVIAMCMGFTKSYTGLMVVRAFLGTAEGGLLPGIVLYLSMMYKRSEVGIRLGWIYSSASLSGA